MADDDKMKVAVLDDYQGVAMRYADWSRLGDRAEVTVFRDHLHQPDAVVARLCAFDVVCIMRERTPLPASMIARLPKLKLIVTTGMWNASLDSAYATGRGPVVCRGEAEIIETKAGLFQIVITSIPYRVNKSDLITRIADLVREKKQ